MKSPLKVEISPEHPLLILMVPSPPNVHLGPTDYAGNARAMAEGWERLDSSLKPHVTIQIEGICDDHFRRAEALLPHAQEAGIPITLQTQTNNADINDTMPLEQARRLVDQYPCIVGLQLSEASHRTFVAHGAGPRYSMGRNARYARDVIRLAGEYGLFMSWQLMSENYAAIGCSADNQALFETVCEYGEYVIPMHEMNSEYAKYIDHLACMGLWMSGATAQWGVEAQSWYWADAGYNRPGSCLPGSLEMPGGMYSIMFLLGAAAGATAYSVEPPWDIWPEEGRWRFDEWLAPTFSRLVEERLIPTYDEVLSTTPVAYHMPRCERPVEFHEISRDLDFDHNEGRLIRATYGVFDRARDAEIVPNGPRYGWIPALPAKTPKPVLDRFERVLRPGDLTSVEHARDEMNAHFPEVDRGNAWSALVGPLAVAANSHENWYVPEAARVTVPRMPSGLRVESRGAENVVSWETRDGDKAYHVWRKIDDNEERLTDRPITGTSYVADAAVSEAWYAVSGITDAEEEIRATLHLHEFLILSRRESRRTEWTNAAGERTQSARLGEGVGTDDGTAAEAEARCAACTAVEDLASPAVSDDDPSGDVKRAVMAAMTGWKAAIESEDVDALLGFYADEYAERDGRTSESVGVAFRSILQRYLGEPLGRHEREWGVRPAWRYPAVRLFVREWIDVADDRAEVLAVAEMWAGGGPELEPSDMLRLPVGNESHRITMVWTMNGDRWRVSRMDPPFIRMEDIALYRFRYQGW